MVFRTTPAPYIRDKRSTTKTMLILFSSLVLVWIAAVITSFAKLGSKFGVKAILMLVVSLVVTAICDILTSIARFNKQTSKVTLIQKIIYDLKYNYSYVTAIIFTLTLPVWVSYYVVIVGSIFATVICKNLFGGFGKNIFNPAAMARIFVAVCFASSFSPDASVITSGLPDSVASATITSTMKNTFSWLSDASSIGDINLFDTMLGNYFGAMGETFTILILVIGIVLSVIDIINWRTPAFYLGTVILSSLAVAIFTKMENPLNYVIYSISLGGVCFGAVFMLTDPVTGPTSPFGKALCGVVAGLLTMLIRLNSGNPEGCVYSIAVCNLISPAIDYICTSKSNQKLVLKNAVVFGLVIVSVVLSGCFGVSIKNSNEEANKEIIPEIDITKITTEYEFVLQEGDTINEDSEGKFIIKNSGGEDIAVIYYASANTTITDAEKDIKIELLVGINISTGKIYDIGYMSDPGFMDMYIDYCVKPGVETITDNSFTADAFSSVTCSYNGIKAAVTKAYEKYAKEYGGKN